MRRVLFAIIFLMVIGTATAQRITRQYNNVLLSDKTRKL